MTISVSPNSVDFGNVLPGYEQTITVTVTNQASQPVMVSWSELSGAFSSGAGSQTITGSGMTTITVTFTAPATAREYSNTLTVTATWSTQPGQAAQTDSKSIKFRGEVVELKVTPTSLDFASNSGVPLTKKVTIENPCTKAVTVNASASDGFSVTSSLAEIAPGATATIDVTYDAKADSTGTLSLSVAGTSWTKKVSLSGIIAKDTQQINSTSYVVYVPPQTGDKGNQVESCFRLGVSDDDEALTYSRITSSSREFLQLDDSYSTANGIALLTPGAINLIASEGVNLVSKTSSSSTTGKTYAVTVDSTDGSPTKDMVISASILDRKTYGTWVAESFTQASSAAINTNFQSSFGLSASYAFFGGLNAANIAGVKYESIAGANITQLGGIGVDICGKGIATKFIDGETYDYFGAKDHNLAKSFTFGISTPAAGVFDTALMGCAIAAQAAAGVVAGASAAYAAAVGGIARRKPGGVQDALHAAEGLAIASIGVNGLIVAMGVALGIAQIVMQERAEKIAKLAQGYTRLEMKDNDINLAIGPDLEGTAVKLDGNGLTLRADYNHWAVVSKAEGVAIFSGQQPIRLFCGPRYEAPLASLDVATGSISLQVGGSKITISSEGIALNSSSKITIDGQQVEIKTLTEKISALQSELQTLAAKVSAGASPPGPPPTPVLPFDGAV